MSQAEKICLRNIARVGEIPQNACVLCRKVGDKRSCWIRIKQWALKGEVNENN